MEVPRLSLHTKRYRDVFTYLQNCMSTKGVHGDLDMPRFQILFFYISIIVNLIQVVPSLIFEMVIVCLFVCVAEICFGFLHL